MNMGYWFTSSLVAAAFCGKTTLAFRTSRFFATKPVATLKFRNPQSELLYMKKNKKSSLIGAKDYLQKKHNNSEHEYTPLYLPRGDNQKKYVQELQNPNTTIVFGTGPAGCGKTLFAGSAAAEAYLRGDVERIVITRPTVSVEEDIGFLPGSINHKMNPWLQPLFDTFLEFFSQKDLDSMMENHIIEISPLGFMRGRTFKRCFVLADEMQNSSPGQMLMLLTRIGEESKLVITGDVDQSDLNIANAKSTNGLSDFLQRFYQKSLPSDYIQWVKMTSHDVERSPVVKQVLQIYEKPRSNAYSDASEALRSYSAPHQTRNEEKIREYKLIFDQTREKMSEDLWSSEDPPKTSAKLVVEGLCPSDKKTPESHPIRKFIGDDIL